MRILVKGGNPTGVALAILLKNAGYDVMLDLCSRRFYGVGVFDCFVEKHLKFLGVEPEKVSEDVVSSILIDGDWELALPFNVYVCRVTDVLERAAAYNELNILLRRGYSEYKVEKILDCRYVERGDVLLSSYVAMCNMPLSESTFKTSVNNIVFNVAFDGGLLFGYEVSDKRSRSILSRMLSYAEYGLLLDSFHKEEYTRIYTTISPLGITTAEITAAMACFHKIEGKNVVIENDILSLSVDFIKNTLLLRNTSNTAVFTRSWLSFLIR